MATSRNKKILISGASIAGPVLAYWLHRYGFQVTVVEKAGAVRKRRLPHRHPGHRDRRREAHGRVVAHRSRAHRLTQNHVRRWRRRASGSIRPEALTGGKEGRDLELPRGELTTVLYDAVRDDVEFRFGDSITTLNEHGGGVDVHFQSGLQRPFDLVIGADGLHSNTRRLAFGPEAQYHRYLGYCFAGFTIPNTLGLSHEAFISNSNT